MDFGRLLSCRSVLGEAFISVGTPVELPRLGDRPKGPVVRTSLFNSRLGRCP